MDIDQGEIKLNDDEQFLLDFFATRVRPSVVTRITDKRTFWFMRLKIFLNVLYSISLYLVLS